MGGKDDGEDGEGTGGGRECLAEGALVHLTTSKWTVCLIH